MTKHFFIVRQSHIGVKKGLNMINQLHPLAALRYTHKDTKLSRSLLRAA